MYLVLNIYLSRMVKTPKVSPLSNRGVRARRVPPVRSAQASHPGGVPKQQGLPGAGALIQSATTLWHQSGGIRYAETARLLSGDAFSVISKIYFFYIKLQRNKVLYQGLVFLVPLLVEKIPALGTKSTSTGI